MTEQGAAEALRIAELLARHEEAIGWLYQAYANEFPDSRAFWTALARDQTNHVSQMEMLKAMIGAGVERFDVGSLQPGPISKATEYVERETEKVGKQRLEERYALSTALAIEQALVNRRYFEVADRCSPEVKRLLIDVFRATERHIERVRTAWQGVR